MAVKVKKVLPVDSAYGIKITQNMIDSYNLYLERHILSVKLAWKQVRKNFDLYKGELRNIYFLLSIHDKSKYENLEYIPYLIKYYSSSSNAESEAAYEAAWESHYKSNPHHWKYWVDGNGPREMPVKYLIEMLLNWHSKSERFPELTAYNQYQEEKDSISLHEETRKKLESMIGWFKEPVVIPKIDTKYIPFDIMSDSGFMTILNNNIDYDMEFEESGESE